MTERRRFIATAGGVVAAAAAAIVDAPKVIAQPKVQWRMSTAWPATLDIMQGTAQADALHLVSQPQEPPRPSA